MKGFFCFKVCKTVQKLFLDWYLYQYWLCRKWG